MTIFIYLYLGRFIHKTMIMKHTAIVLFIVISLVGCANKTSKLSDTLVQRAKPKSINMSIDKFTALPKEIDGCACYFYSSEKDKKEGKYICVNDFANLSFVSINGNLEKFELVKHEDNSNIYLYINQTFDLKIEITKKELGSEESSNIEGTITVKTKDGQELIKTFVGFCGC